MQSLTNQATDATLGHAQGASAPTPQQLSQIVAFETSLYTAQANDQHAGDLNVRGATGGPENLAKQNFYVGINDSLGGDPGGAAFSSHVFSEYEAWARWAEVRTPHTN